MVADNNEGLKFSPVHCGTHAVMLLSSSWSIETAFDKKVCNTNYCCDPGISAHVVHNPTAEYFGVNLIGRIVEEKGGTPCFLMEDISEFHDSRGYL